MEKVDSPTELRKWFSDQNSAWAAQSITAHLKLPESPELNKATVTFEAATHLGIVTVWGGGTLEIIALDLATKKEVLFRHHEYSTPEELRLLLDECSRAFSELAAG